ncbi:MAG: PTS system mannose/fructose/sorbose family transporter subunit IID [Gemmatimonadota bacterium]
MSPLPLRVRIHMLLRSFAVQGSWNYETLIGAGFAFAVLPGLRHLYGAKGRDLDRAVARHAELFNSHPYFSSVAVGAVSRLEADGTEPEVVQRFKTAMRGSLGSMGDRLFWTTWRPMSVILGLVLVMAGAAWWVAIGAFLLVYNSLHLAVRVAGLKIGVESGLDVGRLLREAPLQRIIDRGSRAACFLIGLAVVMVAAPSMVDPVAGFVSVAAIALGFFLGLRTRKVMIAILVGVTTLALAFGFIGHGA